MKTATNEKIRPSGRIFCARIAATGEGQVLQAMLSEDAANIAIGQGNAFGYIAADINFGMPVEIKI